MSMWFILLVPFFIMMVVLGRRNTGDDEEELEVVSTYHGEEEWKGDENEIDSDDGQKCKESSTPLWKYATKLGGGKGRGTTKFICFHCHTTYIGSYTCVRKHLHGIMPWDDGKASVAHIAILSELS
jgi:hypothetical protein